MRRVYKIIRNSFYFFLIYLILSFLTISIYPLMIEAEITFPFLSKLAYSLILSILLLIPSVLYIRRKTTGDYIDAVKIEELVINENEIKDAVTNWVFVKHGKPVMGEVEIKNSSPDGKICCVVNIMQD